MSISSSRDEDALKCSTVLLTMMISPTQQDDKPCKALYRAVKLLLISPLCIAQAWLCACMSAVFAV